MAQDMFDADLAEARKVVTDFYDLLPLLLALFRGTGSSYLGQLAYENKVRQFLEIKREGKEFDLASLKLLDPNNESKHVRALIKDKEKK